jgi:cyclopropane fatty-acyl-phospholipid synthase-like methyltransferase
VCGVNGMLSILKTEEMTKNYKIDKDVHKAVCDDKLDNLERYTLKIFGQNDMTLSREQVLKWTIISIKKSLNELKK